jgi:hypothetical protein
MSNWAPPSAQKLGVIERLTGWLHKTSPERSRMCFRIASPAISLGQWRLSRPIAIDSAKALFEKAPIDRPREFRERMVHIGDLAEARFEKICLPALAPLRGKGPLSLAAPRDRRGYKKNVDDMRESPALVIIEMFQRLSQVLPNVFHRIEFWRVGGKGKEVMLCGVPRPVGALYPAPSRARMACASLATSLRDFCQMKGKCSGVSAR